MIAADPDTRFDPLAALPLLGMHAAALAGIATGVSPVALGVAALLFAVRLFALTAGYHRCFSHRSFRVGRAGRLAFAVVGASAAQMGPLWWAGHHRRHHRFADRPGDPHSPIVDGWFWAHMGWLLCRRHTRTPVEEVADLARFPELAWLDRHHAVAPAALALACGALGALAASRAPELGTSGAQMLVVGFVWSTLALYHVVYAINSLGHRSARRRDGVRDESRNHPVLALLALGDGWHRNHHRFPKAARHGFHWWEIDATWLGLRLLAALGLISDLQPVPDEAYERASRAPTSTRAKAISAPSARAGRSE